MQPEVLLRKKIPETRIKLGLDEINCFKSYETEWDITSSDKEIYIYVAANDFFIVLTFFKNNLKYIHTMKYKDDNDVLQYEGYTFRLTCELDSLNDLSLLK